MKTFFQIFQNAFYPICFFSQFWREMKTVGAVCPSSAALAQKMIQGIDFEKANVIVELGAGTGNITKRILNQMREDTVILVFELNSKFYRDLENEIRDNRMILIHDSAELIHHYLQKAGFVHADYIVSSLPLANFTVELKSSIIKSSYGILRDNGRYIQFQYSLNAKSVLESVFDQVYLNFTPFNVPPAFIYTCVKGE